MYKRQVKHSATDASRFCNNFGIDFAVASIFVFLKMCASKPLCWGGFLRLLFDLFVDLLPHCIVSTFKEEEEDAEKVENARG